MASLSGEHWSLIFSRLSFVRLPMLGEALADIDRNGVIDQIVEILKTDGTPIGTIMALGLTMGSAPPGSPLALMRANNAIVGGISATTGAIRMASMTEGPANRRRDGGGTAHYVLHVIPMSRPEVVIIPNGPAVFHSDFSLVNATQPARAPASIPASHSRQIHWQRLIHRWR